MIMYNVFFVYLKKIIIMENNRKHLLDVNEVRPFLMETAKWAKFLAIVGYVFLAVMAVLLLVSVIFSATTPIYGQYGGVILFFWYIVMLALYYFPITYLYRFAKKLEEGFRSEDKQLLIDSFYNLKSHYKFVGILTVVMLILYGIGIVIAVIFALSYR